MTAKFVTCAVLVSLVSAMAQAAPPVAIQHDDEAGTLTVKVGDKTALQYQYADQWAIPHFWPVNTPSGKNLLEQKAQPPEKFPHHRALWIVDRVQLEGGPDVDFYHEWKNCIDKAHPEQGHKHFIRHQAFSNIKSDGESASYNESLKWIVNRSTPVLDEHRHVVIHSLGNGEYLMDLSWKLTATYGDVKFLSDWVHYAWPYVRINSTFNGEHGGTITADNGDTGQSGTNGNYYDWIDYSNTVGNTTEGLAVFVYPDGQKRKWLTREYGTFGPRRPDALSGTKFTLKMGESISGRVGILVHDGDVKTGRVAERYQHYAANGGFTFTDDKAAGRITLREGDTPVLTYNYGMQLESGVDEKYRRACYVHPLYDLDGKPLTEDFPKDHYHHRGMFWTWPIVKVRGKDTQTWHPANPSLIQHFARWIKREATDNHATLSAAVEWKLDDTETVAHETITLNVHPAGAVGRAIDVTLTLEAVGGPMTLRGQTDHNKGYGGMSLRGAPPFKGATVYADGKHVERDSDRQHFHWADLSNAQRGMALFAHPDHPDYPPAWVTRTSYAGFLNVAWPGNTTCTLEPGKPITLKYRVYVHRGDVDSGKVAEHHQAYIEGKL